MDIRFLKSISEAYVIDKGLELDRVSDIFNELYDLSKFLQENDIYLYDELYSVDRFYQQKILRNYLDLTIQSNNEILNEVTGVEIFLSPGAMAGISAFIIAFLARRPITKGLFKTLSVIGQVFESVGKFIVKRGKYLRFRYSIIQQNFEKCYKRCGISDIRQISSLSYLSVQTGSIIGTKRSTEQAECLRECYLDCLIEIICLHMESYFACLKRTGAYATVDKFEHDELVKLISSTNIAVACVDHYNVAKQAFDQFYSMLDFVYNRPQDESLKYERMQMLRSRLYDIRDQIRKTGDHVLQQRYGQNQQQQKQPYNQQQQNTRGGEGN